LAKRVVQHAKATFSSRLVSVVEVRKNRFIVLTRTKDDVVRDPGTLYLPDRYVDYFLVFAVTPVNIDEIDFDSMTSKEVEKTMLQLDLVPELFDRFPASDYFENPVEASWVNVRDFRLVKPHDDSLLSQLVMRFLLRRDLQDFTLQC